VLASAASANLFRAVRLEDGTYRDGLFSQNPPVRELVARERVTWTLRARNDRTGTDLLGQAEAQFRDGKVTSLRLGPLPPNR